MWHVLESLGFVPDDSVRSEPPPGLSLDFGNLRLCAGQATVPGGERAVLLSGLLRSRMGWAEVLHELPGEVESFEQGVALIVWCLDRSASGRFQPPHDVEWLERGRSYRSLLPWVRRLAEWESRPHCYAERDWARMAVRKLELGLVASADDEPVVFAFDGHVLSIQVAETEIAISADGEAWAERYSIPASRLRRLPKRFSRPQVEFGVHQSHLTIGSWVYSGVLICRSGTASPVDTTRS